MSVKLLRTVANRLVQIIELDATLSHNITRTATVTDYPIESGSVVNDHVQVMPDVVSVTGFVSNNPVGLLVFGDASGQDETRAKSAYDALVQTFRQKELVQVQSELEVFDDMVMTSLDTPRDRSNFNALQFTAEFKKLTQVGTQIVELKEDAAKTAAPQQDIGKQTPTNSEPEEERRSSLLLQALQGVGVLQ